MNTRGLLGVWWRRAAVVGLVAAAGAALAATGDPRGWTSGTLAAGTPRVVDGPTGEAAELVLPKAAFERVTGPTLLFYFSPTCPHCRHVAAEVQALSVRLRGAGGAVLGVASGSATEAELAEFRATYGVTFEILVDTDREIQGAMGVQSTPSAMLVAPHAGKPKGKKPGTVVVRDVWYPYLPGWDGLVEARVTGNPWASFRPGEYQGNELCGACHVQELASWSLTHHAVAWRTLVRSDKDTDPACTSCHVTGAGQPGGWAGDPDSALVNVGCESCHGPGGPHDGARVDATAQCAGCHDADHAIAFSVAKGVPLIDHYKVTALSEAEYEAARRALYAGEAPRSLLAFPTGKNVGSAACLSCHAAEHAWWVDDPHANGMASLQKEGSRDPACVRCHATARASGPPPSELAGFDVAGGVGCESCHGPGEAHVAAGGGTDNIQGLGDSCPVCVIDAVCTSCHTPKWSPDWDLEARLAEIDHGPPAP